MKTASRFAKASLVLCLAGCDPSLSSDPLADREFLSESVEGTELFEADTIFMSFRNGEILADGGCNAVSGPYSISEGRLVIDALAMTAKGCEPAQLHDQDEWLAAFLVSRPTLRVDEPRITLSTDDATVTLLDREVAEPDLQLVGPVWDINGFVEGEAVGFGEWPETSLRFREDGSFAIEFGCPVTSGSYQVDGASLVFSDVTHDLSACPEEFGSWVDIATAVLADGVTQYEIDSSRLSLSRGDRGLWLIGRD